MSARRRKYLYWRYSAGLHPGARIYSRPEDSLRYEWRVRAFSARQATFLSARRIFASSRYDVGVLRVRYWSRWTGGRTTVRAAPYLDEPTYDPPTDPPEWALPIRRPTVAEVAYEEEWAR